MMIEKEYSEMSKVFERTNKNIFFTRNIKYLGTLLSVKPKYKTQAVLTGSNLTIIVKGLKNRDKYIENIRKFIGKTIYINCN